MITNLNCLWSVCEIQYPVAECGTQAQSVKFANQFHGGSEINKQHSDVDVVIFKMCED